MTEDRGSALLVVSKFGRDSSDRYLTNDLAEAFARRGYRTCVLVIPWSEESGQKPERYETSEGLAVIVSPPLRARWLGRRGDLLVKWGFSSFAAARALRKHVGDRRFDVVYALSPLVTAAFALRWAVRRSRATYAHMVDFFPFHHHSLGLVPGGPFLRAAFLAENGLARLFDVVAGMTAAGETYLREHYSLRSEQRIASLPLWGPQDLPPQADRDEVRGQHGLPTDRPIAVFGGQISEGRGIENILAAADLAKEDGVPTVFLFVGRGSLADLVRRHIAEGGSNVRLIDHVERDRYLTLIAACDVGLVATVSNVDVPTFPSKTIDYLRAGLPVVAAVERSTDFGDFVRDKGFGLAVEASDPRALAESIATVLAVPERAAAMAHAGRATLISDFNPDHAVETVLSQLAAT